MTRRAAILRYGKPSLSALARVGAGAGAALLALGCSSDDSKAALGDAALVHEDKDAASSADAGAHELDGSVASNDSSTPGESDAQTGEPDAGEPVEAGPNVVPMVEPNKPAVSRGASYRGFPERFNRYYTDPSWQPSKTVYVSPTGNGNGTSMATPSSVQGALDGVKPGTQVVFLAGDYDGCFELSEDQSGTYDAPVVLYAQRASGGARAVTINCCASGRQTCINLEAVDYVAVDGFELVGGNYGVRAVGADYAASQHQRGVAVLDCEGHGQNRDPFFTGQSDWYVIERSLGYDAGSGDGHGIYLSNGSDWNIVRGNELWNNHSSDFQINADPQSACADVGVDVNTAACDALAGTPGDGGRGVSDFMLVEGNFFHDGLAQGANFTSVRHSIVRNNIFARYARHGVSFWQETENPKLGSSDNQLLHNLFVANVANRQMVQFVVNSDRNVVENNLFVGVGSNMLAMEVDDTVGANQYRHNHYIQARLEGREPNAQEQVSATLNKAWFQAFPEAASRDVSSWAPSASAPFLGKGERLPNVTRDRAGKLRTASTDLGPFER
jgi:hypothetical protein